MRPLISALLCLPLLLALPTGARAGGEGGEGPISPFSGDQVERAVDQLALQMTLHQVLFPVSEILMLMPGQPYAMIPRDVGQIDEEGGLLSSLFESNRQRIFEELARRKFVRKLGVAYRIGEVVILDLRDEGVPELDGVTDQQRRLVQTVQNGGLFTAGAPVDVLQQAFGISLSQVLFYMSLANGKRRVYHLQPSFGPAGELQGNPQAANVPAAAYHVLAYAAAMGQAQRIGNVWEIDGKMVVAAPLDEIFRAE